MKVGDICKKLIYIPHVNILPVKCETNENGIVSLCNNQDVHADTFSIVPESLYDIDVLWLYPSGEMQAEGLSVRIKYSITLIVNYDQYETALKNSKEWDKCASI